MYTNNLFSLITILKYKIKCYNSNFTFFYSRRELQEAQQICEQGKQTKVTDTPENPKPTP